MEGAQQTASVSSPASPKQERNLVCYEILAVDSGDDSELPCSQVGVRQQVQSWPVPPAEVVEVSPLLTPQEEVLLEELLALPTASEEVPRDPFYLQPTIICT